MRVWHFFKTEAHYCSPVLLFFYSDPAVKIHLKLALSSQQKEAWKPVRSCSIRTVIFIVSIFLCLKKKHFQAWTFSLFLITSPVSSIHYLCFVWSGSQNQSHFLPLCLLVLFSLSFTDFLSPSFPLHSVLSLTRPVQCAQGCCGDWVMTRTGQSFIGFDSDQLHMKAEQGRSFQLLLKIFVLHGNTQNWNPTSENKYKGGLIEASSFLSFVFECLYSIEDLGHIRTGAVWFVSTDSNVRSE